MAEDRRPPTDPTPPEDRELNADIRAAEPPTIVKGAAVAQSLSGLLVGLTGLQLVGSQWVVGWMNYGAYVLMALGAVSIFMAANQYRARAWAGPGSLALAALMALMVLAWVGMTFTSVFSCMAFISVPLSMLNAVLAGVAMKGVRETADARRRLSDQGLSLGL